MSGKEKSAARAGHGMQRVLEVLAEVRQMRSCAFPGPCRGAVCSASPTSCPSLAACMCPGQAGCVPVTQQPFFRLRLQVEKKQTLWYK